MLRFLGVSSRVEGVVKQRSKGLYEGVFPVFDNNLEFEIMEEQSKIMKALRELRLKVNHVEFGTRLDALTSTARGLKEKKDLMKNHVRRVVIAGAMMRIWD